MRFALELQRQPPGRECRDISKAVFALVSSLALAVALAQPHPAWSEPSDALAPGEAAWLRRGEGHQGARARPEPIAEAIDAFSEALAANPEDLEARWQLLRALYFKGEYVLEAGSERLDLFRQSREIADQGRQQLERQYELPAESEDMAPQEVARAVAEDPHAARIYYWSAVHWGLWGRYRGKIAAARQGVAKKIRQFAEIVILLDEEMEEAGGHRILGRLHTEAPRLPFFTSWVDRDRAISELRRAMELAPEGLLTHLYLAEALIEFRPEKHAEALDLLRSLVKRVPDPEYVVEQTKTIEDAKAVLAGLNL